MVSPSSGSSLQPFRCERQRAAANLADPDSDLWPVNAHSDPDELNLLAEAAQSAGVLVGTIPRSRLYIYPMSLAEPEPILVVNPGRPPLLLGHGLRPSEREGEDPIAFTLRLLEELAARASALVLGAGADGARLDRIAAFMNRRGRCNAADVCEMVARELRQSGRELAN